MNDFGVGERTETISATTLGQPPVPPAAEDLIKVNSTSILLNLATWETGGCAISSFVVEYKYRGKATAPRDGGGGVFGGGESSWVLVNNNVKGSDLTLMTSI